MVDKWFISDTHFFHENILRFKDLAGQKLRPFQTIEEMHEVMIENWNKNVKPTDKIYHLGDVTFKYDGAFNNLMSRLNGQKRLCLGNHDKIKGTDLHRWFEKIDLWKGFPDKDHGAGFTCSHIPLMLQSLRDGAYNVHGHVHANSLNNPNYINVCVEVRNYTPVNIDEIIQEIKNAHKSDKSRVVA